MFQTNSMELSPKECCVLNGGGGSWAFESMAANLATILGVEICSEPRRFNYLLYHDDWERLPASATFIPTDSLRLASDKRSLATVFEKHGVPRPTTKLFETFDEVRRFVAMHPECQWCLKFPTSCGANGHCVVTEMSVEPQKWPRPFIAQEFIRLENPEVYRTYCAGGEVFGWVARRFPDGVKKSPWVAHARGAQYVPAGTAPPDALDAAQHALTATNILNSFGCVDLIRGPNGKWLVLEVGTDGIFNHVDRELGEPSLESELQKRIAKTFWKAYDRHGFPDTKKQG